jgi:hyperosmotically inducible periplasmic protein
LQVIGVVALRPAFGVAPFLMLSSLKVARDAPIGGVEMRSLTSAVLAITLGLCLSTSALAADRPDSWVTAKTKLALMTTEGIDTWDLNVDTVSGVVTLHGKVATDAAKQKAETVAQGIEGVKSIKNLLQVVPKPQREAVSDNDDIILDRVKKAFDSDAMVDKSSITVASVNKGVVLLSGKAKSVEEHLQAVEIASKVPGVRRVSSEVTVEGSN